LSRRFCDELRAERTWLAGEPVYRA